MRIIFMGTPDFAIPSLEGLRRSGEEVVGVVTQPDRPKGRGGRLAPPPVKSAALKVGLRIIQPDRIKDPAFIRILKDLVPELIVVVAFGRILPSEVLHLPKYGCINVHASLLPCYRGAAPVNWAILRGEKETGVTTMWMDEGMDTGDILLQEKVSIQASETAGSLSQRLAVLGAKLLVETLVRLKEGRLVSHPQDHSRATHAPPLRKEDGAMNWGLQAKELYDLVRGTDPWPGAFTFYGGERWRLWKVSFSEKPCDAEEPGKILEVSNEGLLVATGGGGLLIEEIQPAGKRRMSLKEYLAGHSVKEGAILTSLPS